MQANARPDVSITVALDGLKTFRVIGPRIATAGQPTEAQLRAVAAAGYRAIINLGLTDPRHCLPDEAARAATLGMDYRHIPVLFEAPTVETFWEFVEAMDALSGERVFVHCASNYRVSLWPCMANCAWGGRPAKRTAMCER